MHLQCSKKKKDGKANVSKVLLWGRLKIFSEGTEFNNTFLFPLSSIPEY